MSRNHLFESRKRLIYASATDKLNAYIRILNHESKNTHGSYPNYIKEITPQGIFERDSEFHDRYFTTLREAEECASILINVFNADIPLFDEFLN